MPHFTIEYSRNVEKQQSPEKLLAAVHEGAVNSGLFPASAVKIRCAPYDNTCVGGNEEGAFLHVMARILSGRDAEKKKTLSHAVFVELQKLELTVDDLTVEICDIDRVSHQPCPD